MTLPDVVLSGDGAATKGFESAPIVLIEYEDFECPYCRVLETTVMPAIAVKYIASARLRVVFRHLPLVRMERPAPISCSTTIARLRAGSACRARQIVDFATRADSFAHGSTVG